jgi:outer membrane receptor for ferrienterochelin and colicins
MTQPPFPFVPRLLVVALASALFGATAVHAQDSPPPASVPEPKSAQEPKKVEQVEIIGKNTATDERRNSTAGKIIISRDDIEQYGDTNLGDVMRRLPGVTTGGRPGRPGAPRMRGMGGGFTQILIDGQRIAPGFNLEEISPDQVERIEILRAPTAETGARAIAGTINIVLREPLRQTNNDVKLGPQIERGKVSGNVSLTRNDVLSETGTYNLTATVNHTDQRTDTRSHTTYSDVATGATVLEQMGFSQSEERRDSIFLSGRAQWRLGVGEQLGVQTFVVHNEGNTKSSGNLTQLYGADPAPYATRAARSENKVDVARLNLNLNRRFDADTRYEMRVSAGNFGLATASRTEQFAANGMQNLLQTTDGKITDKSWNSAGKVIRNVALGGQAITAGYEVEGLRRSETSITTLNGARQLADLGTEFAVSTQRAAVFVQDEWDPHPDWSTNLGLRYEEIITKSAVANDTYTNVSRVLTPVAHAVWRFASPGRDQVRLSLTQSYKSPTVQQLSARPTLNTLFPVPGSNTAVTPDRAGNPNLKPELANGVDLAYESYLKSGGIISVNLFQRNIRQFMRNVVTQENVSWANLPRYVNRPQNLGNAVTRGIEFDAKFQLKELIETTQPLSLRANVSLFDSKVDAVPGPNNRIDQQPHATANIGFDYRVPGAPLTLGGNLNWTPGYDTQLTITQAQTLSTKRVFDAYALWTVNPSTKLRLSLSNLAPQDSLSSNTVIDAGLRQVVVSNGRTDMSVALRLEMRL